jgi:23S rRNA pseudouridine955/2504/2580 synthase
MDKIKFQYTVLNKEHGSLLIDVLVNKFTYYSREKWIENFSKITLNGNPTKPEAIILCGDRIEFTLDEFQEPPVDSQFYIPYEDEYLIGFAKSGDIPVHPTGRYRTQNLLTIAEKTLGYKLFTLHRIDRETSGIILFAKFPDIASQIQSLFEKGLIHKEYIVYVHGIFPEFVRAEGYLGKDETSLIRKKKKFFSDHQSGIFSSTNLTLLQTKSNISKLKAEPITGRIHQIRATLLGLGYPIVGDKIYGTDEKIFLDFIEGKPIPTTPISRQALHSYKLSFIHPVYHREVEIIAEEPSDMKNIFTSF